MPGPVIRMAPNPRRRTSSCPPIRNRMLSVTIDPPGARPWETYVASGLAATAPEEYLPGHPNDPFVTSGRFRAFAAGAELRTVQFWRSPVRRPRG